MMNKEQKQIYIKDMTAQFENSEAVLVTHYQGLNVKQLEELRKKALVNAQTLTTKEFKDFKDKIIFKEVSFNYQNKKNIIHNCSFEIKKRMDKSWEARSQITSTSC